MEKRVITREGKKQPLRRFVYQPTLVNETMCIGVTGHVCNETLSLIETDYILSERPCRFIRQKRQLSQELVREGPGKLLRTVYIYGTFLMSHVVVFFPANYKNIIS